MKNCSCGSDALPEELRRAWERGLRELGLLEFFERIDAVKGSVASSLSRLARAERAEALGLDPGLVEHARAAAMRDNAAAVRGLEVAKASFGATLKSSEWKGWERKSDAARKQKAFAELLAEARERVRDALLESELGPGDAREILDVWDRQTTMLHKGGLAGLLREVPKILDEYLAMRRPPHFGRNPHSPLTANQWACIALATAGALSYIAWAIITFAYHLIPVIVATWAVLVIICIVFGGG